MGSGEFITTVVVTPSELQSQALSLPELQCTWITVKVFCPSTTSVKPLKTLLSFTECRTESVGHSVLDLAYIILKLLLKYFMTQQAKKV